MSLSLRVGLAVAGAPGDTLAAADLNQGLAALLATRRVLADLLGGAGLLSGGAAELADLPAGTHYPPFRAVVDDAGGEAWLLAAAEPVPITFLVTDGDGAAYLVLALRDDVPAAALGGRTDAHVVAQAAADPAPVHSLLLGTGPVTAGAFTAWTPAAGLWPAATLLPPSAAHLAASDPHTQYQQESEKGAANGYAALDAAGVVPANQLPSDLAHLAGTETLTGDKTFSGTVTLPNAKVVTARDTKYGPPTSGTFSAGAAHLDRAGAVYRCTAAGTPGTWVLERPGTEPTFTDLAAGNFNGGSLLDGYVVYDPAHEMHWVYDTTRARWRSADTHTLPLPHLVAAVASTTDFGGTALVDTFDVEVLRWRVSGTVASADSSNYWMLYLQKYDTANSPSTLDSAKREAASYFTVSGTPSSPVVAVATYPRLWWRVEKNGSPGNLTIYGSSLRLRYLR